MPTYTYSSSMIEVLKELYAGHCPPTAREEKTETHTFKSNNDFYYETELQAEFCEGRKSGPIGDLVFKSNPFLRIFQNDEFTGSYVPVPIESEE